MSKLGSIGIDFGTTKTWLSYYSKSGTKIIITQSTAVFFESEDKWEESAVTIGNEALNSAPEFAWRRFKLYMGLDERNEALVSEFLSKCRMAPGPINFPKPHYLATLLLRELRLEYLKRQNIKEDVEVGPVTITVPAEWNFRQRQSTIYAAYVAGFKDVRVLEEPVAAYLMHHFNDDSLQDGLISLVMDFGGGTCDMALVQSKRRSKPSVLSSRTVDIGGEKIDDAIVNYWLKNDLKFVADCYHDEQIPPDLLSYLTDWAKKTKEGANPSNTDPIELLRQPFDSQGEHKLAGQTYILNHNSLDIEVHVLEIEPPKLTPAHLETIMSPLLEQIGQQLSLLLLDLGEDQAVQHIIMAGGSSYIRQFINWLKSQFSYLHMDNISFAEPEKAISYGALDYQYAVSSGKASVQPRLSLSTYLEIDYDPNREITNKLRRFSQVKFLRHKNRHFIVLAERKMRLSLNSRKTSAKNIPFPAGRREINWKVFQVRRVDNMNQDYQYISDNGFLVDEIQLTIDSKFDSFINKITSFLNIIRFHYSFDEYGDFYRAARPYVQIHTSKKSPLEKAPEFDWHDENQIEEEKQKVSKHKSAYFTQLLNGDKE